MAELKPRERVVSRPRGRGAGHKKAGALGQHSPHGPGGPRLSSPSQALLQEALWAPAASQGTVPLWQALQRGLVMAALEERNYS